jgi:hypothetical protein
VSNQHALYLDVYSRRMSVRPATTRLDGRLLGLCVTFLLLITAAGLLYLTQAGTVAQLRYELQETGQERAGIEEQIAYLRSQIAEGQSIAGLEERVDGLGLVDASAEDPIVVCGVAAEQDEAAQVDGAEQAPSGSLGLGRLFALLAPSPDSEADDSIRP